MASSVANQIQLLQHAQPSRAFLGAFTAHTGVSHYRVSPDKTSPSQRVSVADLDQYEFFTPPRGVCAALIVDVDRPEAVLEIFDTIPAEIHPSWVIETPKGAQAGWMIDRVDLRAAARDRPQAYARAVGEALRAALAGDEAVNPVNPVRVRNPAYVDAERRSAATPPIYGLRELHQGLKTAGLWPERVRFTGQKIQEAALARSAAAITTGTRNQTIFDVARHAAYAGQDHAAVAWATNEAAAEPLSANEVQGVIRSISRFMARAGGRGHGSGTVTIPDQMRELLSEMGRRGGQANTPAQRAARALGTAASVRARKRRTDDLARKAQRMHAKGHTRRRIAEKLATSLPTLCRWLRRYVATSPRFINGASGVPCSPRPLPRASLPGHCFLQPLSRGTYRSCFPGST